MKQWQIILTKQAKKDARTLDSPKGYRSAYRFKSVKPPNALSRKIASSDLKSQAQALLEILQENPYQPPYEKLVGNLAGYYSRRINIQHRLVYEIDENKNFLAIDWLPIKGLELHGIKSQRKIVMLKLQKPQHPVCTNLIDKQKVDTYTYFSGENIADAQVIVSNRKEKPLIIQIPFGEGFILTSSIDLPFLNLRYSHNSDDAVKLFNSIINWGLDVPSLAVTFASVIMSVRTEIGNHEAHLLEKADQAMLLRRFSDACDYAHKAFERIIRNKAGGNTNLHNSINSLFPQNSSDNHFCHAIRLSRNASAHGTRLLEEITVEETECLFSSIKLVILRLI